MYFLLERQKRLREALAADSPAPLLSDFLMEKDRIFANLNLDDEELKLYERYYDLLARDIPAPDLVIYLQAKPETLRARIAKKAAHGESHISPDYIEEVARAYEHFFFRYEASDLLVINTSDIDFVERSEDLQQLLRRLQEPVKGTQYFLPVGAAFTSLTAATILKRLAPKKSVLLLEAKKVGNGASGRTGGMVLAETAAGNLPGLGDVLKSYRRILRDLRVNADLDLPGVWEIARGDRSMDGKKIKPLRNSSIDWSDSGRVRIVRKVPGGTVDPGKVVDGLARAAVRAGALVAENAEVTFVKPLEKKPVQPTNSLQLQIHWRHSGRIIRKLVTAHGVLLATNAGGLHLAEKIFHAPPDPKPTFALATAPLTKKQIASLGLSSGRPFSTLDLPYLWGSVFET